MLEIIGYELGLGAKTDIPPCKNPFHGTSVRTKYKRRRVEYMEACFHYVKKPQKNNIIVTFISQFFSTQLRVFLTILTFFPLQLQMYFFQF